MNREDIIRMAREAGDDGKPYGLHLPLIEHHWDGAQAKANAALAETALQQLTDVHQEIEAAMADQVTYGLGITLDGKRIDPASIYKQAESATCQESRQVEPVAWAGHDLDAISEGLAEAQVVYQISMKDGAASSAWIDVDEAAYNSAKLYGEYKCRCLYTAPPQQPVNLQDIEQYRMQMAGICTAALGYWTENNSIHPDYDTPALRDVAKLYVKYAALYTAPPQRKPLTNEEILKAWKPFEGNPFTTKYEFARAIERAHGIGGEV